MASTAANTGLHLPPPPHLLVKKAMRQRANATWLSTFPQRVDSLDESDLSSHLQTSRESPQGNREAPPRAQKLISLDE